MIIVIFATARLVVYFVFLTRKIRFQWGGKKKSMRIDHQEMTLNPALTHSGENKRKDGLQTGFALKKQNAKTYTYKAPFLARVHSAL